MKGEWNTKILKSVKNITYKHVQNIKNVILCASKEAVNESHQGLDGFVSRNVFLA